MLALSSKLSYAHKAAFYARKCMWQNSLTLSLKSTLSTCTTKMSNATANCTDLVWIDLEMTGLDVLKDKILEVACVITDQNLQIRAECMAFAINYPEEVYENMSDWCKEHHYKSGLVARCRESKITTQQAETLLLEYLKQHIPENICPLAGSSVYMDRLFVRAQLPSVDSYLHYRIIDVSTIKELCMRWNPDVSAAAPKKKFLHRGLDDIMESIEELQYYRRTFLKSK